MLLPTRILLKHRLTLFVFVAVSVGCHLNPFVGNNRALPEPSEAAAHSHEHTGPYRERFAEARALEKHGELELAIAAFQRLREEHGTAAALHRLGVLYDQRGDFKKANACYQEAIELLPDNAELVCDAGYSRYLQGDWLASEDHLQRALAINPLMKRAHNNLALLYTRTNRPQEAIAAFRVAAEDEKTARDNFRIASRSKHAVPVETPSLGPIQDASVIATISPSKEQSGNVNSRDVRDETASAAPVLKPLTPELLPESQPPDAWSTLESASQGELQQVAFSERAETHPLQPILRPSSRRNAHLRFAQLSHDTE